MNRQGAPSVTVTCKNKCIFLLLFAFFKLTSVIDATLQIGGGCDVPGELVNSFHSHSFTVTFFVVKNGVGLNRVIH